MAPSFPAEFADMDYRTVVGILRALGFDPVLETSFGADLVAREYRKLVAETNGHRYLATTCPAICGYVERYFPDMVGDLAPIVSPMIATARAARRMYGDAMKVVFIGPCVAKKVEAEADPVAGEINAVLTFVELRKMIARTKYAVELAEPSEFDPPYGATVRCLPSGAECSRRRTSART